MELINRGSVQIQISATVDGVTSTLYLQPHGRATLSDSAVLDPNQTSNPFLTIQKTTSSDAPVVVPEAPASPIPEGTPVPLTGNATSPQVRTAQVPRKRSLPQPTTSKGVV